jgi:hypothetical protein
MGVLLTVICTIASVSISTLDDIRTNYALMVNDKELCKKSISYLQASSDRSELHVGYLGGLETIWANHVLIPISKLKTFNKGKENIEKAIQMAPNNAELRFIRLSIQLNLPDFLGYNQHIKEDSEFLKRNRSHIQSKIIQGHLDTLLMQ